MCLGIPAQLVELTTPVPDLATADVGGVRRAVNVGLLSRDELAVGDWVLVHVGFAMARIDEDEAATALAALREMGLAFDDEMRALVASPTSAPSDATAELD